MSHKHYAALAVALLAAVCTVFTAGVSAATLKQPGGITISPAFQDVVIADGQPAATFDFSVTNNTGEPYEFSLSAVDFGSLDESGGVLFLGEAEKSLDYTYGLAQWVTLERDRIVVDAKATVKVPVTIENKQSMTPGGHYGAILVSPTERGDRPTKVQINQVLSSLLFVRKQGGELYSLGLQSFDLSGSPFAVPSLVDMRFQNSGNVHVVPRGVITVKDPHGRLVSKGLVNQNSAIALPGTFRKLTTSLSPVASAWLPGRYTMSIAYRFDGQETAQVREQSFYYFNFWYAAALVLLLMLVIFAAANRKIRHRLLAPLRELRRRVGK